MPQTIRFHLDEHASPRLARGLRARGIDVTTSQEARLLRASDDRQRAFAVAEGRVLVTNDADFLRLHARSPAHPGIVFYPDQSRPLGQLIRAIALVWEVYDPDEMAGRIEFI